MKKNLNLGLLIPPTFTFNSIITKSKKRYVKFLVFRKEVFKRKKTR